MLSRYELYQQLDKWYRWQVIALLDKLWVSHSHAIEAGDRTVVGMVPASLFIGDVAIITEGTG